MIVAAELLLCAAVVAAVVLLGVDASVTGALAAAAERSGSIEREAAAVTAAAARSAWTYAGGIGAMMLGRLIGAWRSKEGSVPAPLLLPAVAAMTGLGLMLQWGYADPLHASAGRYYGPAFAPGVLLGGIGAGLVMALPWDPARLAVVGRVVLGVGAAGLMVALALFGQSPGSSGARINLLGVQPIEVVKLAFVAFLAGVMGRRAAQLRYQRSRLGVLHWPRLPLLLPALALTAVLFLLMFAVRDLGPTLIAASVLVLMYFAAVRSWVEVAAIGALVGVLGLVVVIGQPGFLPDNVLVRADMMRDPWLNGHTGGDQLAASLWAMAAGGLSGQGLGQGAFGMLPAGHTDLILAHLTEVGGLVGLAVYSAALLGLVLQGLLIAALNRTPERVLLAYGIAGLLLCQWLIIFGGTLGILPLTGVVVPYLSFGKSSMILFMVAAGLLGRLATGGRKRAETDELTQLRGGVAIVAAGVLGVGMLAAGAASWRVLVQGPGITAQGVLTVGWDDTVFLRYDPRIRAIAARIPRGEIRDRQGGVLAGPGEDGERVWPLGDALGTLLGPVDRGFGAAPWAIEGLHDAHLRGLEVPPIPLAVYVERRPDVTDDDGQVTERRRDRILRVVQTEALSETLLETLRQGIDPGSTILFTRLRQRDHRPLVPLLRKTGAARERAIAAVADDIDARSLSLTLDGRLQAAAGKLVSTIGPQYGPAAALVVLDVDTGEVLARAQWPDFDPGSTDWEAAVRSGDPQATGSYGLWRDKTGVGGLYQAGSIFKIATALAAVRTGQSNTGRRCQATGTQHYSCQIGSECRGRPCVQLDGWQLPIHDGHSAADGRIELAEAIEVSCNVYFAQLGVELGPQALTGLVDAGLEVDAGTFDPGEAGSRQLASTAYGQGAARMHAMQAARMVASVGAGGVYRRCPSDMVLGQTCTARQLADAGELAPILAGMRKVIDSGTARSFADLEGVRVYGKTGTATDPGRRDEAPYGITQGSSPAPHSWFVAFAEAAEGTSPCSESVPGRLAVAAVVPRGGGGSGAARLLAQGIIAEASRLGYFSDQP